MPDIGGMLGQNHALQEKSELNGNYDSGYILACMCMTVILLNVTLDFVLVTWLQSSVWD